MAGVHVVVNVFEEASQQQPVAKIALNGYNIGEGGVFGNSGAMRSFVVEEDGNERLWDYWNQQRKLVIRDAQGVESKIRIFALPVEEGSSGFVEFIN